MLNNMQIISSVNWFYCLSNIIMSIVFFCTETQHIDDRYITEV